MAGNQKDPFEAPDSDHLLKMGRPESPAVPVNQRNFPAGKDRVGRSRKTTDSQEVYREVHFVSADSTCQEGDQAENDVGTGYVVTLTNPEWSVAKAKFNERVKISVQGDLPEALKNVNIVCFTVHAIRTDGRLERIEAKEAPLHDGKAEAEVTLYQPQLRDEKGELLKTCEYIFVAKHRDSKEVSGPLLPVQSPPCKDKPDRAATEIVGTCPFYTWRHLNFRIRHSSCARRPPTYYLDYGYKYCQRFSQETYPKLSPVGKAWLMRARLNLQLAIEEGLGSDESHTLELDSDRFREFAFNSHPDAYWDAGMASLPLTDLLLIGYTPDIKEWRDGDTWAQAFDIGGRLVEIRLSEMQQAAKDRAEGVVEYFKHLFE